MVIKRGPIVAELFVFARGSGGGGEQTNALGRLGGGRDDVPNLDRIDPTGNDVNLLADGPFFLGPLTRHHLERSATILRRGGRSSFDLDF